MDRNEKELKQIISDLMKENEEKQEEILSLKVELDLQKKDYEDKNRILLEIMSKVEVYENTLKQSIEEYNKAKDKYLSLHKELKKEARRLKSNRDSILIFTEENLNAN